METGGYDPRFFELLAEVEPRSFWFRARNRLLVWAFARSFPHARDLLEVGCGGGFVLAGFREALPALRLGGCDLFTEALELARRRVPDAELVQADARELPYEAEWDVAGCFDVLEHVEEDDAVLREVHRALRPRGGLLLHVPQHAWLWSDADRISHHVRRYSRRELVAKVRRAGFRVETVTSLVTALLPVLALTRRRRLSADDLVAQLAPPAPANRALEALLGAELALVKRGVSLPAGGSLLVAARKMPA